MVFVGSASICRFDRMSWQKSGARGKLPHIPTCSSFVFGLGGKRARVIGRLRSPPSTSPRREERRGNWTSPSFPPSFLRPSLFLFLFYHFGGQANVFSRCEKEQQERERERERVRERERMCRPGGRPARAVAGRGVGIICLPASPVETAQSPHLPLRRAKLHCCRGEED